jgi:hypothetical protein
MTPPAPPISRAESNVHLMSLIVIASAREGWFQAAASIRYAGPLHPRRKSRAPKPGIWGIRTAMPLRETWVKVCR